MHVFRDVRQLLRKLVNIFANNYNITDSFAELARITSESGVLFYIFNSFKVMGGYFAVCLIATLIAILAIVLNEIVIHTILCESHVKKISDYLFSCLAISDLSCGIMFLYKL